MLMDNLQDLLFFQCTGRSQRDNIKDFETKRIFDSRSAQKSMISDDPQITQNGRVIQSFL